MTITAIQFYKKREPNAALVVTDREIVTPFGTVTTKSFASVAPSAGERIQTLTESANLFESLSLINVILTNACNLDCDYCYEQHELDFGRFTADTLKQVYDFLLGINDQQKKRMQFFGGEPLIHKKLILQFLQKYGDVLTENRYKMRIDMVTNGLLLSEAFIDEYCKHEFTDMLISMDTDALEGDHRNLSEKQVNHILKMIDYIPQHKKDARSVCIRNTVSVETAPRLVDFVKRMYGMGIRSMVIHPLTMSFSTGFIMWPTDVWNKLREDVTYLIMNYPDFNIQFSEGVGIKGDNNCMTGSDMIAMDGSGDYSGCYFFTNMKDQLAATILGNIFDDKVYIDRYVQFQTEYEKMFDHPQCKSCTMHKECYQCPAGNLSTGNKQMFRPDGMCMEIVSLYNSLHHKTTQTAFLRKLKDIIAAVAIDGEQFIFAKSLIHLTYFYQNKMQMSWDPSWTADTLPPYEQVAGYLLTLISNPTNESITVEQIIQRSKAASPMSIDGLYVSFAMSRNAPPTVLNSAVSVDDGSKRAFYLTLVHMLTLNRHDDPINKGQ